MIYGLKAKGTQTHHEFSFPVLTDEFYEAIRHNTVKLL